MKPPCISAILAAVALPALVAQPGIASAAATAAKGSPADLVTGADGTPGYRDTDLVPGTRWHKHDPDRPQPPRIAPGRDGAPPSDAIVLFDGKDHSRFEPGNWEIRDGTLVAGDGNIATRDAFGDIQLHLEWIGPVERMDRWTNQGNSGVLLMGHYEIQIFDSHSTKIYADGNAASVYGETPPLVNATLPPGQWQTYDILFRAPVFEAERLVKPGRVTVLHNGVVAQLDTEILGQIAHRKVLPYKPHEAKLPLVLTGHHCPVRFRNIWVRPLQKPTCPSPR